MFSNVPNRCARAEQMRKGPYQFTQKKTTYITCFPQTAHIGLLYVVIKTFYDDITPLAIDIDLSVGLTFIADRGFAASRFVISLQRHSQQ